MMKFALLTFFLLTSCIGGPKVPVIEVRRGNVVSSIIMSGRVESSQRAIITAPYEGPVDKMHVGIGYRVDVGSPLITLSTKAQVMKLREEKARLAKVISRSKTLAYQKVQMMTELTRLQTLLKTRSIAAVEVEKKRGEISSSDNEIESTQAELRAAQSNVQLIETQIAEATLKSTIKGTVTSTWVPLDQFVEGSPVKIGDPLVMVSGEGSLTLKSTVREQDVLKITTGMPVEVSLPAIPGRRWMGRLVAVDDAATIDQSTGAANFRVQIRFDVKDIPIKSGMDASATIVVGLRKNVLLVPRASVSLRGGGAAVQLRQGRKFKEIPIKLGLIGDTHVEIVDGVQEAEAIMAIYDDSKSL